MGNMSHCRFENTANDAIEKEQQPSEPTPDVACDYCGRICKHCAAHNARVEDGVRYQYPEPRYTVEQVRSAVERCLFQDVKDCLTDSEVADAVIAELTKLREE
jgi:hypothetical protein